MYLLDTVTISAIRTRQHPEVLAWLYGVQKETLFLSVLTVAEIEQGARQLQKKDPAAATALDNWLDTLLGFYGLRILPVTVGVSRHWGRLAQQIGNRNFDLGISATALEHKLIVVTRNVRDFMKTGVTIYDPFEAKTYSSK